MYVTEPFAALLALEPDVHVATEYVGHLATAKDYGELPMYVLLARRLTLRRGVRPVVCEPPGGDARHSARVIDEALRRAGVVTGESVVVAPATSGRGGGSIELRSLG